MADNASLRAAWRRGATPPPDLDVVEWAEGFRKLSKESSNGGRFRTSKVEVARGPMLWATEPGVSKLTLMACTQLLKTTVIENILGRFIHLDPCPILAVLPKDDAAETFSKDRFAPMVRDSKALRDLFGEAKSRDAGATLTHKQFPGGHITMVGASSPTNLSMRPIRLLVCDEIDKYPLSAGGEGPPIDLAEERQAEFKANSLTVLACSPTIAGRSAIEASYDESDQRKAFVHCPHPGCGTWQPLEWEQVRFDKDEGGKILPATARYECIACERPWTEAQRLVALKLITMRRKHAITLEHLRVTALRGVILDSDGSVILDLFAAFGVQEKVIDFALGTPGTDVLGKCQDVTGYMEDNLQGETMTGVHALASPEWFGKFTRHNSVKEAFKYYQSGPQILREDVRKGFVFGGIFFEEYRGAASYVQEDGSVSAPDRFVPAGDVRFFPTGTGDTFTNYWGPPDFWSSVNQAPNIADAEVFVAPLEPKRFGKGVDMHTESNPLPLVKRPALLVRGTTTN